MSLLIHGDALDVLRAMPSGTVAYAFPRRRIGCNAIMVLLGKSGRRKPLPHICIAFGWCLMRYVGSDSGRNVLRQFGRQVRGWRSPIDPPANSRRG